PPVGNRCNQIPPNAIRLSHFKPVVTEAPCSGLPERLRPVSADVPEGIDSTAFSVLYYSINSAEVDDGNAKGLAFLPTPEMQPMRLPCELRYRLDDSVSCMEAGSEWGFPN